MVAHQGLVPITSLILGGVKRKNCLKFGLRGVGRDADGTEGCRLSGLWQRQGGRVLVSGGGLFIEDSAPGDVAVLGPSLSKGGRRTN